MQMYSSKITLECNHDYFNEYPVSNIKGLSWNPLCHCCYVNI